jgi:hypothetical protein
VSSCRAAKSSIGWFRSVATISVSGGSRATMAGDKPGVARGFEHPLRLQRGDAGGCFLGVRKTLQRPQKGIVKLRDRAAERAIALCHASPPSSVALKSAQPAAPAARSSAIRLAV